MSIWLWVGLALILGVVAGNLLLLKQTAKTKLPKTKHNNNDAWDKDD